MAKRSNDENQFIKINPLNNSNESTLSVALLNALEFLNAKEVKGVKIPTRKELTKIFKNTKFENLCRSLDEVDNIRIRPVPCMEAIGTVGIVCIDHPVKPIYCLALRDQTIKNGELKLVNSALGEDVITISEEIFIEKLAIPDEICYQILLNTGDKIILDTDKQNDCSCNDCCRYAMQDRKDICLYDNSLIEDINKCCNKYLDCFKWKQPKGE